MELSKTLKYGEKLGLDELEIFVHITDVIDVEGELGEISKTNKAKETDIFVRGIVDKRVGFGFTNDMRFLNDTVKKVYSSARANKKDKNWQDLPEVKKYHDIEEYDPEIEKMSVEEVIDTCQEIIDLTPEGITPAFCDARREIGEKYCINTNGIEISERGTWNAAYSYLVGKTKTGVTPGCLGIEITRRKNLDLEKIVSSAADDVKLSKNLKKAGSGLKDVIIHPYALEDLLCYTLLTSILGENVVRGKSFLKGKIGSQVFSEKLTMTDDPLYKNGVSTMKFDFEGVPAERTSLIKDGILENFLWNDYWAKIAGKRSTGNAYRNILKGTVETKPTNIVIEEGNDNIFDIKEGYYVKGFQGAHSSNPESGEFSVVCNPGFKVENGEITGGCVFMISGNIYDLLKNIEEIGREKITGTNIISPLIRFKVHTAAK